MTIYSITRKDFLEAAQAMIDGQDFEDLRITLEDEHYKLIEDHAKKGGAISANTFDSLDMGKRFHFLKHYGQDRIIPIK